MDQSYRSNGLIEVDIEEKFMGRLPRTLKPLGLVHELEESYLVNHDCMNSYMGCTCALVMHVIGL